MSEYEHEPIRGLPGLLPEGETILWQGGPDWRVLARAAFHVRGVALYFALLVLLALAFGSIGGMILTLAAGTMCLGLLFGLAWLSARTTVYTLTSRRIVLRIGIALPKCLNLPLVLVQAADLRPLGTGHGDIALGMEREGKKLGYLLLWPHARPWKLREPQPMLRAVPDAEKIASLLAGACAARVERAEPVMPTASPVLVGVAA